MSRPAWAMGSAATPPAAPRPMMTTSVSLSRVAMISAFAPAFARIEHVALRRGKLCSGLGEHRVVVRRLVIRLQRDADPLVVLRDDRADAGIPDEIPADEIRVSAVERIAEGALDGVRPNEIKEGRWQAFGPA